MSEIELPLVNETAIAPQPRYGSGIVTHGRLRAKPTWLYCPVKLLAGVVFMNSHKHYKDLMII